MGIFGPPNIEKMKAKKNVKGLIKALDSSYKDRVRIDAAEALGQIGDPKAIEALEVSLMNDEVGKAAAEALGNIGGQQAIIALVSRLDEYAPPAYVAEVLAKIGGQQVVKMLVSILNDMEASDFSLEGAAKVLEKIGMPDADIQMLVQFMCFETFNTKSPDKALKKLCFQLMPLLPALSSSKLRKIYRRKAEGVGESKYQLVEVSVDDIRMILLAYFKTVKNKHGFKELIVDAAKWMRAAMILIPFNEIYVINPIVIWRSPDGHDKYIAAVSGDVSLQGVGTKFTWAKKRSSGKNVAETPALDSAKRVAETNPEKSSYNKKGSALEQVSVKDVTFDRKMKRDRATYELYTADDTEKAKDFLLKKKVNRKFYYVEVETPNGTWGIDKDGMYLDKLLPWQKELSLGKCEGEISKWPSIHAIMVASQGLMDNAVAGIRCGKCEHEWWDGIRLNKSSIVRCPKCKTYNKIKGGEIQVTSS